jgi:hypothetical protein
LTGREDPADCVKFPLAQGRCMKACPRYAPILYAVVSKRCWRQRSLPRLVVDASCRLPKKRSHAARCANVAMRASAVMRANVATHARAILHVHATVIARAA